MTNQTNHSTPGAVIRAAREARGLLQRQVDAACDLSEGFTSKMELDKKVPSPELALRLAAALGVSARAILPGGPWGDCVCAACGHRLTKGAK